MNHDTAKNNQQTLRYIYHVTEIDNNDFCLQLMLQEAIKTSKVKMSIYNLAFIITLPLPP